MIAGVALPMDGSEGGSGGEGWKHYSTATQMRAHCAVDGGNAMLSDRHLPLPLSESPFVFASCAKKHCCNACTCCNETFMGFLNENCNDSNATE